MQYSNSPYNNSQFNNELYNNELYIEKKKCRKELFFAGNASGLSIIGFMAISTVVGLIIRVLPSFRDFYTNNSTFSNAMYVFISTLFLGGPFLIAHLVLKKRDYTYEIPFGKPFNKKDFWLLIPISLMICILASIVTGLFANFIQAIFGIEFTMPDDNSSYATAGDILINIMSTAMIPALVEEFIIRGVVLQSLRRYGDRFAIIVSAFIFAILHGNMIQTPFAFFAGLALGFAAVKTGTLWTGVIIHFLNNSIAVISEAILANTSETFLSIFSVIMYAVVIGLGVLCTILYTKRHPNPVKDLYRGPQLLSTKEKTVPVFVNPPMIIAIIVMFIETAQYINFKG